MTQKLKPIAIIISLTLSPFVLAQETLEKTRVESTEETSVATNIKVLDTNAIESNLIKDAFDTVRYLPGVEVNNTGNRFGDNGFNIRGMDGDAVAITLDGLGQGESLDPLGFSRYGMFSSTRNAIEPESVKSIEILKGANSVVAGSGALGGAVLYTTKDADDYLNPTGDGFAGAVKLGYDGRNSETLANVAMATRRGAFEGLLILTQRDGSETKAHGDGANIEGPARGVADPFEHESTNVLAKLSYSPSADVEFGLVFEDYVKDSSGQPLSRQSASYFDFQAQDESRSERVGVWFDWQANNPLFDSMSLKFDDQEINNAGSTLFLFSSAGTAYLRNEDRQYTQELTSFSLDFDKALQLGNFLHELAFGISSENREVSNFLQDIRYNGTTVDSGLRDGYPIVDPAWVPDTESDSLSLYLTDSIDLSKALTLNAGIRYDETSYSPEVGDNFIDITGSSVTDAEFDAVTWSVNLQYELGEYQRIWASVGTGFKALTTQELYYGTNGTSEFTDAVRFVEPNSGSVLYVPNGRSELDLDTVANPDLEAEESTNYELAYQWQKDGSFFNVSVFRSDFDNFIVNINQASAFDAPITQASFNWFLPQCAGPVFDDSCWTVATLTEDTWGVPTNASEVEVTGFEIDAGWQINQNWMLTFSHAQSEGEYTNSVVGSVETGFDASHQSGDALESITPDTSVLGLSYLSSSQNWGVSSYARFIDGKEYDATYSATFYSEDATVVDLNGFYELTDNTVIRAAVNNLFDEKYALWPRVRLVREGDGGFFGGVSGNGIDRFSEPGREFALNLTYNF
ncbi:MAG: TonB-dependent hemoglobin/transferrin/lactoferrin family receptor [Alteromonadaceae bacterium]|nr:TonB-dependent hemoglobin/transferrin/lactoferrin family receptor [Alteromonadaceae bacterium]